MRRVDPKVYSKEYYLNVCLGGNDFKRFNGMVINKKWEELLNLLKLKKGMNILDLGCGRGDVAICLAKKGINVTGIDYSKDAIELANKSLKKMPLKIRKLVKFFKLDAKIKKFKEDTFDAVISLDVFEHLYKEELFIVMENIANSLKKDGILLVHTETNKIYLDYTHPFYAYPLDWTLLKFNKYFFSKDYQGLPKDPRNEYHKIQHVNEPTIFYLKDLFRKFSFKGRIISVIGGYKPISGWKDKLYNIITFLYPLSKYAPLNILFATEYICIMKNDKKT